MLVSIWHVFYSHRGSVHQLDNTVLEDYMPLKLLTWIDQSITVYFHIPLLYIIRNVEGLYYISSEAKMHASGAAVNKTCHAMYSHHLSILKIFRIHSMFMYLDLPRRECTWRLTYVHKFSVQKYLLKTDSNYACVCMRIALFMNYCVAVYCDRLKLALSHSTEFWRKQKRH